MVLPESMRIKGHRCFDYLYKTGDRFHGSSMVLRVAKAKPQLSNKLLKRTKTQSIRCAVVISNKVSKKAVCRNRLRRLLHEHLRRRLLDSKDQSNKWALLSLKPKSPISELTPLLKECDQLLKTAGLIL